jgi:hypothetical protein
MFDYLLYRMFNGFEKRFKGEVNSLWLASLGLIVFQFLIFYSIAFFVYFFSGKSLFVDLHINTSYLKLLFAIFFILMSFVYYKHYKKKIKTMSEKYKNHKVVIKDRMLIIIAITLVLSPILWDWLYKLIVG